MQYVPRLSYFYGISIYMYPRDHNPPHFHANYGEFSALFLVATGETISGGLTTACGETCFRLVENSQR